SCICSDDRSCISSDYRSCICYRTKLNRESRWRWRSGQCSSRLDVSHDTLPPPPPCQPALLTFTPRHFRLNDLDRTAADMN
ncbi:hypothetical protein BaRGS_00012104, partial [Batillaria attramentaria]